MSPGGSRQPAGGCSSETAINAVAWSIVGFHLIGSYLHETRSVTTYFHALGYSAQSIALRCGLGDLSGLVVVAICAALLLLMLRYRRDDSSVFALAGVMGLGASPLVWDHYFAFMLVPVAIAFPRLNRVWPAPLLMYLCSPLASAWWEPWRFWIVALYLMRQILSRSDRHRLIARAVTRVAVHPSASPALSR